MMIFNIISIIINIVLFITCVNVSKLYIKYKDASLKTLKKAKDILQKNFTLSNKNIELRKENRILEDHLESIRNSYEVYRNEYDRLQRDLNFDESTNLLKSEFAVLQQKYNELLEIATKSDDFKEYFKEEFSRKMNESN